MELHVKAAAGIETKRIHTSGPTVHALTHIYARSLNIHATSGTGIFISRNTVRQELVSTINRVSQRSHGLGTDRIEKPHDGNWGRIYFLWPYLPGTHMSCTMLTRIYGLTQSTNRHQICQQTNFDDCLARLSEDLLICRERTRNGHPSDAQKPATCSGILFGVIHDRRRLSQLITKGQSSLISWIGASFLRGCDRSSNQ